MHRRRAEPLTIVLGLTAAFLAAAIVGVVALGGGGDAGGEAQPPSTTTIPTTTTAPSSTTLDLGDSIDGTWTLVGEADPTMSITAGSFVVDSQVLVALEADVDAGLGQAVRLELVEDSVIYPAPTTETPSSMELQLDITLNGVLRRHRTIAVLTPTGTGLELRYELTIDPALFDLAGAARTVAVSGSFELV